jgi:alanyl-tRNA synthetase
MEKLGLNDIRRMFREFYVSKEHYPAKSASLIPQNDRSLLLINSGMAPLKPYFAGLETPPAKRMTTCQKCIRTGDIENVGKTARHGTFFEMLGNFSFGDYFKEQSLTWGWEFITEYLKLPEDRLWASVYEDDDDAYEIWKKLGVPEERIVRLGKDDNFWEIGLGPCGPCSEIYFDRGEEYGCGKPDCKPGCECDRYIEFWNHVFTQFSREEDGTYTDLAHPNIDTGMGLERIACICQGVDSIFDIDTIKYIRDGVTELAKIDYKDGELPSDVSVRIITDHLRSMVFMIGDGIIPSNEGRGYVLRRLIRRAARHGKLLGIKGGFLSGLVDRVVKVSGEAYPEIAEKQEYIKKIISVEEEKFASTIDQGTSIIGEYIEELKTSGKTVLDGEKVFRLYDTYGFPPELTEEILEEEGFGFDKDGFAAHMEKQKEMARAGRKAADEEGWKEAVTAVDVPETIFVGYKAAEFDGKILAMTGEAGTVSKAEAGQTVTVYLDQTPFYAEGGGQVCDKGIMSTLDGKSSAKVVSVTKSHGVYAHRVEVTKGALSEGEIVKCCVDVLRRNSSARNHTATHLLHAALREIVGNHVQQAGSFVSDEALRFDFTHFEAVTAEQLKEVENTVNENILRFIPVEAAEMTMDEARAKGAMALFGEKYGDIVRMVSCGDVSRELCGGIHVGNTGQIGAFKIVSEAGVASGVRRIEAVTGLGLLKREEAEEAAIKDASAALKTVPASLAEKAAATAAELKAVKKELDEAKKAAMGDAAGDLYENAKEINGKKLITVKFEGAGIDELRSLSDDIKKKYKGVVMVLAAVNEPKVTFLVSVTDDLVEAGVHAGKLVKEIAAACGGGGGGKADMAQAGAKDSSKISDAFTVAESLLK